MRSLSGMLGFGHNAEFLEKAVAAPHCMANIMTPSFSQHSFYEEFVKHVGFTRKSGNPYSRVFAMNSGSEAVELSARLTDTHAKLMTNPGAVHEGRRSTMIVLEGSFYGRTYVMQHCALRHGVLVLNLFFQSSNHLI
jgi:4-aminobutyrate aminotransferase-like enzyme